MLLIPMFEKDMAAFYIVPEDDVFVIGVNEVGLARERSLQEASLEVDFVILSKDREHADDIVAKTEDGDEAMEAVKASVETAALVVLKKEIVVVVVVEEVEKEFVR